MKNKNPCCRKNDIVMQELDGEILIYDLNTNKAMCLNQTSALIWKACDGNKSIADIGEELRIKLNSSVDENLIWLALEQFEKENLIENKLSLPIEFERISRREILQKIGFATIFALPMISSIIAPMAINASSTVCSPGSSPSGAVGSEKFCRCVFPGTALGATCGIGDGAFSTGETCKAGCICTHSNFGNGTCG